MRVESTAPKIPDRKVQLFPLLPLLPLQFKILLDRNIILRLLGDIFDTFILNVNLNKGEDRSDYAQYYNSGDDEGQGLKGGYFQPCARRENRLGQIHE